MGLLQLRGSHSRAARGSAPREGIPGPGGLPARLGWGLQHQPPCALPAKPWGSCCLCPVLPPCCTGPRAAADGMATKSRTLANTAVEPAAYREPRTSSPAHDPHPEGSSTPAHPAHGTSEAATAGAAVPGSQQALVPPLPWDLAQVPPFPACAPGTRPPLRLRGAGQNAAAEGERDGRCGVFQRCPQRHQPHRAAPGSGHSHGPSQGNHAPHREPTGIGTGTGSRRAEERHPTLRWSLARERVSMGQRQVPGTGAQPPPAQTPNTRSRGPAAAPSPPPPTTVTPPAFPMH